MRSRIYHDVPTMNRAARFPLRKVQSVGQTEVFEVVKTERGAAAHMYAISRGQGVSSTADETLEATLGSE